MLKVSLSTKQPKKLIFCSQKVPGGFQPRQPSLERILSFPGGFLAGRGEINTPRAERLVTICIFYQWNGFYDPVYPLHSITRQFISNIPPPAWLREDTWAATDLFSLYPLPMQQHLEMPGQPTRVYLPDATNTLRGSILTHEKKKDYFFIFSKYLNTSGGQSYVLVALDSGTR